MAVVGVGLSSRSRSNSGAAVVTSAGDPAGDALGAPAGVVTGP